jgi:glutaredoxin
MPSRLLLAAVCLFVSHTASAQELYRWVDKDGKVHYTQQPPARDTAKAVESRKFSSAPSGTQQLPYALQQAIRNYPVTLYTTPECKQGCVEARDLLARRGVPYREVSVTDERSNEALKAATGDNKVPAATIGAVTLKGFEQGAMNGALDTAGYPAAGTRGAAP